MIDAGRLPALVCAVGSQSYALSLKARGSMSPDSPGSETHQREPDQVRAERRARWRARDKRNPEREGKREAHEQPQTDKGEKKLHSAGNAAQFVSRAVEPRGQVFPNQRQFPHRRVEVGP